MEVFGPDGMPLALTTAEFQLLRVFAERPNRVLSRDQLLDLLRGENWAGYDRTIDGLVSRLRKKIGAPEVGTPIFKTVHGAGYMFTPRTE
jgi:two-component system OmpR family response regulator